MTGERNMIRSGWRWDVIADFPCNTSGVRVATRKTKRGAGQFARTFYRRNRPHVECVFTRLRHDPLLDDVMNKKRGRRG
jgi:hypothetical protein